MVYFFYKQMGKNNSNILSDLLTLEYHGPKVELGRMDSYQVAANIIAFSDFLGILTKNTLGDKIELRTEIQGIRGESFDIDFLLAIGGFVIPLLSQSWSMKDYFDLLKEAIKAWIHLKGLPPKETSTHIDNSIKIENQDGQFIYIKEPVFNLITDRKAGEAVQQFIQKPLSEGISHLSIKSSNLQDCTTIEEKDAYAFKQVEMEKLLTPIEIKMHLQIESPTFKEGNKWRVFDGEQSFFVYILDKDFLEKIDSGVERFGKGDILVADVRMSQSTTLNALKMEKAIIKVHEHVIAPEQKRCNIRLLQKRIKFRLYCIVNTLKYCEICVILRNLCKDKLPNF